MRTHRALFLPQAVNLLLVHIPMLVEPQRRPGPSEPIDRVLLA
jgi:hypothetical protein